MSVSRDAAAELRAAARAGLLLLGALGLLISALWILGFAIANADIDTQTQQYVDELVGGGLVWGFLYIVALGLLIPGLVALTVLLYAGRNRTLALIGLVLGALSISLLETVFGVLSLGAAVVAQVYNGGNTNVLAVLHKFEGGHLAGLLNAVFGAAVVLALLAAIAYSVALWRSGVGPKWAVISFGVGFVLLATSAPFSSLPGGILLAVACWALARSLRSGAVIATEAR